MIYTIEAFYNVNYKSVNSETTFKEFKYLVDEQIKTSNIGLETACVNVYFGIF